MSSTENGPDGARVHGTSTIAPAGRRGLAWWIWLIPLLLLLAVVFGTSRGCNHDKPAVVTLPLSDAGGQTVVGTPALGIKKVVLPGGTTLDLEPTSLNFLLQEYLASAAVAPRTFVFDNLNFATASAVLPDDGQATVDSLALVLKAYPNARVRLDGYADSRGSEPANVKLGADRAQAVAVALRTRGVAEDRITAATGGDSNPVASNATAEGRAANRRTELVVLSK